MRTGRGLRSAIPAVVLLGATVAPGVVDAAATSPQMHRAIERSCVQQMFMSEGACACLADRAMATLDQLQQSWLTLGANNVGLSAPLSKQMSRSEANGLDRFMHTVPDQCSQQAGGQRG